MRLLHISTDTIEEFVDDRIPPYAILSHRWDSAEDELTYKDFKKGLKRETSGYSKIRELRDLARQDGLELAWIDTCCIDKRSSAELSEAINSMFSWYRNASICYAYLKDVSSSEYWEASDWWQRGWTLQELVAPADVVFCDQDWHKFGTKREMAHFIEGLTGIPSTVLTEKTAYMTWSVAQKMSWAAGRCTTRIEDEAYSLLGLFRINMPLLYGEGAKAFQRLQLEILQKYPDESVLAWLPKVEDPHHVLATRPADFKGCTGIEPEKQRHWSSRFQPEHQARRFNPPRITSWGIEICANARRLEPLHMMTIKGQVQWLLWAFTLTIARDGGIRALPCTLVLVRSGPAPFTYQRLKCFHADWEEVQEVLCRYYKVGQLEKDKMFYLQFDDDVTF